MNFENQNVIWYLEIKFLCGSKAFQKCVNLKIGQHFDKFMNEQLFTFVESMCNIVHQRLKNLTSTPKMYGGQNPGPKPRA